MIDTYTSTNGQIGTSAKGPEPLAIIGIACRYPGGVTDPESYWRLMCDKVDAISEIPEDRWNKHKFYDKEPGKPGKSISMWGGFLNDVQKFDAAFFGISPREAGCMDPQQRLVLESTFEALEDAGLRAEDLSGTNVGVFVGVSTNDYGLLQLSFDENTSAEPYTNTGQALSIAANRISYQFNWKGPSTIVDTACSSALLAHHFAAESIWRGESSLAVVSGINLIFSPFLFVGFTAMGMLSPTGRCRAFSANGDGYVRSEGIGTVILKPLSRALHDGDKIYALIRGTSSNQDGRTPGLTVPSQSSQEALLREACRKAGLNPLAITYAEAHGTGTPVGDPIETRALGAVLGPTRAPERPCILGSIKANIGHLESGSGTAGLIKAALVLKHGQVPPNIHFDAPNPNIDFEGLRLKVPTEITPLPRPEIGGPACACVNSFGFGGTNAHAVLQEPPAVEEGLRPGRQEGLATLYPLSARGPEALVALARKYADALSPGGELAQTRLEDVAYSMSLRRSHHEYRAAVVARNRQELLERLGAIAAGEPDPFAIQDRAVPGLRTPLAFVFSGQGPQWYAMGRELLDQEPVFRDMIERCDEIIRQLGTWSLLEELQRDEQTTRIPLTTFAQPAIFAIQVALGELWRSWGIEPDVVVGHSIGEVAAAYTAGVFDLEDAVKVIYHRGRTMDLTPERGRMLAVGCSSADAEELVKPYAGRVGVAAYNSPNSVTLSGEVAALEEIAFRLKEQGKFNQFLQVDYAFHSHQMDPAREELLESLADIQPKAAALPMYSTITGQKVEGPELGAEYWWQNVRQAVRFSAAMERLMEQDLADIVEISPHPVLMPSITECYLSRQKKARVITSLRRKEPERVVLLRSLGVLYGMGCPVDWDQVAPRGEFVDLPTYPWQRELHWRESSESLQSRTMFRQGHPLLGFKVKGVQPTWQAYHNPELLPYVKDHKLSGSVLLPGTAFIEMGLALGREIHGEGNFVVADLRLLKPYFLPEGMLHTVRTLSDPRDGSFSISTHPANQPDRPWTQHVLGAIRARPPVVPEGVPVLAEVRRRCTNLLPPDAFYHYFAVCGFPFGPLFRGLKNIYLGFSEALAEVEIHPDLEKELDDYIFHPVLLDICLQPNFGAFMAWGNDRADLGTLDLAKLAEKVDIFMPSGYEEIRVHGRPKKRLFALARLLEFYRDSALTDVYIYDEEGNLIAEVRGFATARAGRAGNHVDLSTDLLYQYDWKFQPRPGAARMPLGIGPTPQLTAGARAEGDAYLAALSGRERYEQLRHEMDAVITGLVCDVLHRLGADSSPGAKFTSDELAARVGLAQKYRPIFERYLKILSEDGVLRSGDGYEIAREPAVADPVLALRRLLERNPGAYAALSLLGRFAKHLPAILRGQRDPSDLLFPRQSLDMVSQLIAESPEAGYDFRLAAGVVNRLIAGMAEGSVLRVLELRAGTGDLASALLPLLPAERYEYFITDLTDGPFGPMTEMFQGYPGVTYKVLDIEKDLVEQGLEAHGFDLVLGLDALHRTCDLKLALANVKKLLASEGVVLFFEPSVADRFTDLTYALADEWWKYTDRELRGDQPVLGAARWVELLGSEGFTDATNLVASELPRGFHKGAFLARGPRVELAIQEPAPLFAETGRWLLFADNGGIGDQIAARLQTAGEAVTTVRVGDAFAQTANGFRVNPDNLADFESLLKAVKVSATPRLRGVLYCWNLDVPAASLAPEEFSSFLEPASRLGTLALVHLTQAWTNVNGSETTQTWLLTRGCQPIGGTDVPAVHVEQSPLWGMGRVLINEFPHLSGKLVDLGSEPDEAELEQLISEISAGTAEDELAFRGHARYVHRFGLSSLERYAKRAPGQEPNYRLYISEFGIMDGMRLRPMQKRRPLDLPTMIEIEVKAAALNFADVLKAMSLYPGIVVSEWDVPVGIECSGVVSCVGAEVKDLKVGDEVVAVSPWCFASHAYTEQRLCVKKPKNITFEEAATIPIVFLTSYYAMHHLGRIEPGEKILIHAATGGVGLSAIQLARNAGADVWATAGSAQKRELLELLGVEHVMDSRSLAFADEVMEKTRGKGVDLILNSLSGEGIAKGMSILANYGRFLEIGKRDIYTNTPLGMRAFRKNTSFLAIDLERGLREKPDLFGRMFRTIMADVEAGKLFPLPHRVFPIGSILEAFKYMAKAKHTGKVVISMQANRPAVHHSIEEGYQFDREATYLVTGGLGGFGVPLAEWMFENGARNLVLVGRRGIYTAEAANVVEKLRQNGANVVVRKCDVSDPQQVKELIDSITAELPPLRGVMHAAVVLDDGLMVQLNRERLEKVYQAKMYAAWYLHAYTQGIPLDFFVMFSSTSAVFGNPGQGNYSAANTFLDYLAHHRRALGLPALTVNWGYLGEIGVAAGNKKLAERFEKQGVKAVPPAEGLPLLGRLMRHGVSQTSVMRIDWARMRNLGVGLAGSPRFSSLIKTVKGESPGGEAGQDVAQIRMTVLAAAPEQRREILLDVVREKVARVLGTSPSRIEVDRQLMDIGLDSLTGFELRNWIEGELKVSVPVVELIQGPTVGRLTDLLLTQLEKEETGADTKGLDIPGMNWMAAAGDKKRGEAFLNAIQVANQVGAELVEADGGVVDLPGEATLDESIDPTRSPHVEPTADPQNVFLTGATGFLGAFLLGGLLQKSRATIYCHVRADSTQAGLERIRKNLAAYGLWQDSWAERIVAVPGDLKKPLLGIAEDRFEQLAGLCDVVYHNGASVNLVYSYSRMKAANVGGTIEALRFACHTRVKPFHHVSTAALFSLMDHLEQGVIRENSKPVRYQLLHNGYLQSKWVAERIVEIAQARGLKVSIHRPGIIGGDTRTGVVSHDDVISRLIRATIEIGCVNKSGMKMAFTPVDYVGAALVHISLRPQALGKNYLYVSNDFVPVSRISDWIRDYGYELEEVSYADWREKLKDHTQKDSTAMGSLSSLLPEMALEDIGDGTELIKFDCSETLLQLEESGIECPATNYEILATTLDYFVRTGLLPPPPEKAPVQAAEPSLV